MKNYPKIIRFSENTFFSLKNRPKKNSLRSARLTQKGPQGGPRVPIMGPGAPYGPPWAQNYPQIAKFSENTIFSLKNRPKKNSLRSARLTQKGPQGGPGVPIWALGPHMGPHGPHMGPHGPHGPQNF